MSTTKPLSGDTSIADWLADPTGSAILTDMLAQGGQTPDAFKPVRRLAIKRLVKMSQRRVHAGDARRPHRAAPPPATCPQAR